MVSQRDARLTLVKKDDPSAVADCSSVLDMLIMAAGFNTELELLAEGPEAKVALEEVERYFNNKFDEEL
jgi:phosphotransferase system HPr-like phosphotransfer protein